MNIKPMATAICRTPAFSPEALAPDSWPALKEMIKEASPTFYQVIAGLSYDELIKAEKKIRFSVWKYWNRARYRATPFGSFASISFIPLGTDIGPLILADEIIHHSFTDWSKKDEQHNARLPIWFQTNSTLYLVEEEIRYIRFSDNHFELATVQGFAEMNAILHICRDKTERISLHIILLQQFNLKQQQADQLLKQMLDKQLLLSENSINITGQDYFKRLGFHSDEKTYIISERKLKHGGIDALSLQLLPEYFHFISNFIPTASHPGLDRFCREFTRRFDQKAIPLSIAMDPETGIGYGDTAMQAQEQQLPIAAGQSQISSLPLQPIHIEPYYQFLLQRLIKGDDIHLEYFKSSRMVSNMPLPNTFSVITRFHNGIPVIENIGGCTANSLLGRFTIISPEAEEVGRKIAMSEQNANPEVLFFDVAYQAEKTVDNVNRRQQLYAHELPVLCWSCSRDPFSVDDLLVMVRNGGIILWSQKHQQRVVPRLASAYNYTRSDLAVYRFICDLQHQGLHHDLNFSLRSVFPDLEHYPRVWYKNLIISGAMWKFSPIKPDLNTLKDWLRKKQINKCFVCGNGDQTLCFNPLSDADLNAFLMYASQQKNKIFYITEALLSDQIKDQRGIAYHPQYIVNFAHDKQLYTDYNPPEPAIAPQAYLPGNEWLYFEIYCHPARSNQLIELINKFTNKYKKTITKWFFIRYTDPSSHLRLRLHLKDVADTGLLISNLSNELQPLYTSGLVSDFQLKTYHRESERYGSARIHLMETFFYRDSIRVAKLLAGKISMEQQYVHTIKLMEKLLALAEIKDSINLVNLMADKFSKEFTIDKDQYKQINRSFEKIKQSALDYNLSIDNRYACCFIRAISDCGENHQKKRLIADIFHMHINRLFSANQRMHEAILYQYLLKLLKVKQFRTAMQLAHESEH